MKDCFEMSPTCLTGGYPHPSREFPMLNMSMPTTNWQYHQMYQSRTVSPSERRDSGLHSSSEGQASSPSSDESERFPNVPSQNSPQTPYYFPARYHEDAGNVQTFQTSSPVKEEETKRESTPPPQTETNVLQNLQMSVERNLNISSPESTPMDKSNESVTDDGLNHEDYSVPTLNSHGKVKMVKCKQCKEVFKTKLEFWTHQREHIKPERLLECEKCPFVTEYKHHLEYHLRNHGGEKPFKCEQCDYKCVNKSMLNSHMKSHSSVYQYRCATCIYNSKYCHSLKLHLRKYGHQPAMVLNPDGTPNPLPIIDVYGTRRGPKVRTATEEEPTTSSPKRIRTETNQPPQLQQPMPEVNHLQLMAQDPNLQMKLMLQQAFLMQTFRFMNQAPPMVPPTLREPSRSPEAVEDSVLDLSKEKLKMETPSTSEDEDEERVKLLYNVKVEHDVDEEDSTPPTPPSQPSVDSLRCPHCCITFDDIALFTIHMRFHNFSDPFTCNSCGQKCENRIEFTVHIFSKPH